MPLMTLAVFWLGEHQWVIPVVVAAQAACLLLVSRRATLPAERAPGLAQLTGSETVEHLLSGTRQPGSDNGQRGAALVVRQDGADDCVARHGSRYAEALAHELGHRLGQALREHDVYCRVTPNGFGVALFPQRHMELGTVLAVAHRIQAHLGQSFSFESVTVWPSVSIGFCLSPRAAQLNGLGMLDAAAQAAGRALRIGPSGLYSYSAIDLPSKVSGEHQNELRKALESGEICAYFQPQICAFTGQISGLEALARWEHPQDGLIAPAQFLPSIEAAGLSGNLTGRMLRDSLAILGSLDAQGITVPTVSINLSAPELRNPKLTDEISWELDRHDLPATRLVVEILETVVADSDDDIMVRNIARLAGMGCGVDLDDFGTGHAAIANVRRFAIGRLKIDRSFITHIHQDRERQRMVAAILSMAEQLELDTLAEGVECDEERALLARLGCKHLQGFGNAHPMPGTDIARWIRARRSEMDAGKTPIGAESH